MEDFPGCSLAKPWLDAACAMVPLTDAACAMVPLMDVTCAMVPLTDVTCAMVPLMLLLVIVLSPELHITSRVALG